MKSVCLVVNIFRVKTSRSYGIINLGTVFMMSFLFVECDQKSDTYSYQSTFSRFNCNHLPSADHVHSTRKANVFSHVCDYVQRWIRIPRCIGTGREQSPTPPPRTSTWVELPLLLLEVWKEGPHKQKQLVPSTFGYFLRLRCVLIQITKLCLQGPLYVAFTRYT